MTGKVSFSELTEAEYKFRMTDTVPIRDEVKPSKDQVDAPDAIRPF